MTKIFIKDIAKRCQNMKILHKRCHYLRVNLMKDVNEAGELVKSLRERSKDLQDSIEHLKRSVEDVTQDMKEFNNACYKMSIIQNSNKPS